MAQTTVDGGSTARRMVNQTESQTVLRQNAHDLERELEWFRQVLDTRFKLYFGQECAVKSIFEIQPPELGETTSAYAHFVNTCELSFAERVTLVLALVPHIRPQLLDVFFTKNKTFDRRFSEFGGVMNGAAFIPTGETLIFVLAGEDLEVRFNVYGILDSDHFFMQQDILRMNRGEGSVLQAPLQLSDDMLSFFTTGRAHRPDFGTDFPARYIETRLTWDDLVLHPTLRTQIDEIETWLRYGSTLMDDWGMAAKLRPGYRSLFYGPPGTGKTVTACVLGKVTGRDVYKIDLALTVSKYIGETEKNLARVFDQAQHKGWILFFDEADALFGKRSETKDSHDRYANQEVAFLLQRLETFDGVAILASNRRENLDEAFSRRFESMIYFPMPQPEERLRLWKQGFPAEVTLEPSLDLQKIAQNYVMAGGAIMNVIRYALLQALKHHRTVIAHEDVLQGIRREYAKEGKAQS
jgi:AAA+ superfamily predicted ATPase